MPPRPLLYLAGALYLAFAGFWVAHFVVLSRAARHPAPGVSPADLPFGNVGRDLHLFAPEAHADVRRAVRLFWAGVACLLGASLITFTLHARYRRAAPQHTRPASAAYGGADAHANLGV